MSIPLQPGRGLHLRRHRRRRKVANPAAEGAELLGSPRLFAADLCPHLER